MHSGLWQNGGILKRGMPGDEISRQRFLSAPRLTEFVIGDSAMKYAVKYESHYRQGKLWTTIGGGLVITAIFSAHEERCLFHDCQARHFTPANVALEAGGMLAALVGQGFIIRASRDGQMSIWWHNAGLPR